MTPDAILAASMQGTARRPLQPAGPLGQGLTPGDPATPARLLALAVQARLFALPAAPVAFDKVTQAADKRPLVPDDLRPMIRRLVAGKGLSDDDAALALALTLRRTGLRLHPFDGLRLQAFIRHHAEIVGLAPACSAAPAGGEWQSWEALDASNWTLATPARKAAFIAEWRATDPAGARALVEAQVPLEKADVRLRLVEALATGLSNEDRTLLEQLAGDRAPTVKQAATRLLARLPGTGAADTQIAELKGRITRTSAGLLRKRLVLALQLPAHIKLPGAQADWIAANFGAVACTPLAHALGLSPAAMLDAARGDELLVRGIAYAACGERNWPLVEAIARDHAPDIWTEFLRPGLAAFGLVTDHERAEWASAAIPVRLDAAGVHASYLTALHHAMGGPLPLPAARAMLAAVSRTPHPAPELLTGAVALMPADGLPEVAAALDRFPDEVIGRASLLAFILLRLHQGPDET